MSTEEALIILAQNGRFLEQRTTGYGTTLHCPHCGFYITGCSGDPKDHKENCRLGQALELAEELKSK